MTEHDIQKTVFEAVFVLEALYADFRWIHHSPSEVSSPARARRMKAAGTRAGILDIEWALRREIDGTTYSGLAIELKAGKNGLTAAQRDRVDWLQSQGWLVRVCRSSTEVIEAILAYFQGQMPVTGKPERPRPSGTEAGRTLDAETLRVVKEVLYGG